VLSHDIRSRDLKLVNANIPTNKFENILLVKYILRLFVILTLRLLVLS
jgi:hypothetical protein